MEGALMFTGLVEQVGTVRSCARVENYMELDVATTYPETAIRVGDSISCDGTCLTVVASKGGVLRFQVSDETLRVTIADTYRVGSRINLEQAMRLSDRLMGHLVTGHIDTVGVLHDRIVEGMSLKLVVGFGREYGRLVVPRGSIALNGVSLTILDATEDRISVNLIPHTVAWTNLGDLAIGDGVNVEFDLYGKYVARRQTGEGIRPHEYVATEPAR